MQRKRLKHRLLFGAILLTLVSTGCKRATPSPPLTSAPRPEMVLRVACPADVVATVLRSHARAWAGQHGARIEIIRQDAGTDSVNADKADIWVMRPAALPHWASAGRLAPLPETYRARDNSYRWGGLLPLYREHLLSWDRVVYGLPLLGESPLCCYRADLLANPVHQEEFQKKFQRKLEAPATWEEFAAIAAYFHEQGVRGEKLPSLPPLPTDDHALVSEFYAVAASMVRRAVPAQERSRLEQVREEYSFEYDLQTGRPRIDTPGFVTALRLLQRLQKHRPAQASSQPAAAFQKGRAVLCLADASWLLPFQNNPGLRDQFGILPLPGSDFYFTFQEGTKKFLAGNVNRVPYLGASGWVATVARGSPQSEAAFALLADLSGPRTSEQIALEPFEPGWGGGPIRDNQLKRERWDAFDLDAAQVGMLKETLQQTLLHPQVKNPVRCLRTPAAASHEAILAEEVRTALTRNEDATATLARVARRWIELDKKRGLDTHKTEYRLSLGLLSH